MTKDKELLDLALEALESWVKGFPDLVEDLDKQAITAIKQALAAPVQEPVATVTSESGNPDVTMSWWHEPPLPVGTKLYTTPPAANRQWIGLTEDEREQHRDDWRSNIHDKEFRAIEAKLKEKNDAAQPAPKNRKDALRKLLLSEDGLTAQECEWVNEVNEGDKVKLRGGQSVAVVKSVYRQKGLAPDYYTLILANGDTLDLSGDEIADIYEPAAPEKGQP